jgi:hypothetical protein
VMLCLSRTSCHSQIFDENGAPLSNVTLHMVVVECVFCNPVFGSLQVIAGSCTSEFFLPSSLYVYCSSSNSLRPSSSIYLQHVKVCGNIGEANFFFYARNCRSKISSKSSWGVSVAQLSAGTREFVPVPF